MNQQKLIYTAQNSETRYTADLVINTAVVVYYNHTLVITASHVRSFLEVAERKRKEGED